MDDSETKLNKDVVIFILTLIVLLLVQFQFAFQSIVALVVSILIYFIYAVFLIEINLHFFSIIDERDYNFWILYKIA